jgi:hypothetical protein
LGMGETSFLSHAKVLKNLLRSAEKCSVHGARRF